MNDLISRQSAIDTLADMHCKSDEDGYIWIVRSDAWARIDALPSVQPEIIRCRDCKHWDKTWTNNWPPDYHYCPMVDGVRKSDFYCAYAEWRADE